MIKRTVKTHHDIFVSKKDESQCHDDCPHMLVEKKVECYHEKA